MSHHTSPTGGLVCVRSRCHAKIYQKIRGGAALFSVSDVSSTFIPRADRVIMYSLFPVCPYFFWVIIVILTNSKNNATSTMAWHVKLRIICCYDDDNRSPWETTMSISSLKVNYQILIHVSSVVSSMLVARVLFIYKNGWNRITMTNVRHKMQWGPQISNNVY